MLRAALDLSRRLAAMGRRRARAAQALNAVAGLIGRTRALAAKR